MSRSVSDILLFVGEIRLQHLCFYIVCRKEEGRKEGRNYEIKLIFGYSEDYSVPLPIIQEVHHFHSTKNSSRNVDIGGSSTELLRASVIFQSSLFLSFCSRDWCTAKPEPQKVPSGDVFSPGYSYY